jgi:serine/threonine protein phosphatase PrpC
MGTTIVLALFLGKQVIVANLGDSRCYLYSSKKWFETTIDRSLLSE